MVLGTSAVATFCRMSPRTAAKLCDSGRLKSWKIPGSNHRRVMSEDLVAFMREHGLPTEWIAEVEHVGQAASLSADKPQAGCLCLRSEAAA